MCIRDRFIIAYPQRPSGRSTSAHRQVPFLLPSGMCLYSTFLSRIGFLHSAFPLLRGTDRVLPTPAPALSATELLQTTADYCTLLHTIAHYYTPYIADSGRNCCAILTAGLIRTPARQPPGGRSTSRPQQSHSVPGWRYEIVKW